MKFPYPPLRGPRVLSPLFGKIGRSEVDQNFVVVARRQIIGKFFILCSLKDCKAPFPLAENEKLQNLRFLATTFLKTQK